MAGAVAFVALAALVILYLIRRRKKKRDESAAKVPDTAAVALRNTSDSSCGEPPGAAVSALFEQPSKSVVAPCATDDTDALEFRFPTVVAAPVIPLMQPFERRGGTAGPHVYRRPSDVSTDPSAMFLAPSRADRPEVAHPGFSRPEVAHPGFARPEVAHPDFARPEGDPTGFARPEVTHPPTGFARPGIATRASTADALESLSAQTSLRLPRTSAAQDSPQWALRVNATLVPVAPAQLGRRRSSLGAITSAADIELGALSPLPMARRSSLSAVDASAPSGRFSVTPPSSQLLLLQQQQPLRRRSSLASVASSMLADPK